jgi:hypothetical protein
MVKEVNGVEFFADEDDVDWRIVVHHEDDAKVEMTVRDPVVNL